MASKPRSIALGPSVIATGRAVTLARAAGLDVTEVGDGRVVARGPSGAVTLPVLTFAGPPRAGERKSLERLVDRIAASLGEWRFALHVEQELAADVDAAPIARAALLWRMALDKGEKRRHARYADEAAMIDLSVTERSGSGGMHVGLGPLVTADRLVELYAAARQAARAADRSGDLVLVLHADPAWSLPRGYVLDMLYGTPDCVVVDGGWRAAYRPQTSALFVSEPRLLAVWFVAGPLDAATFHATAFDNPWHPRTGAVAPPGSRCAAIDSSFARSLLRTATDNLRAVGFASLVPTPWSTP